MARPSDTPRAYRIVDYVNDTGARSLREHVRIADETAAIETIPADPRRIVTFGQAPHAAAFARAVSLLESDADPPSTPPSP